jgi:hypothetical protein
MEHAWSQGQLRARSTIEHLSIYYLLQSVSKNFSLQTPINFLTGDTPYSVNYFTDNNNRPTGGSGILVRKDITYSRLIVDTSLHSACSKSSGATRGRGRQEGEWRAWSVYVWWGVHGCEVRGFRFAESEHDKYFRCRADRFSASRRASRNSSTKVFVVVMSRRTSDDFHTFGMQNYLDHL